MYGILKDYEDLCIKFDKGEISFEEFSKLCYKRSKELDPNNNNPFTEINKHIISNT